MGSFAYGNLSTHHIGISRSQAHCRDPALIKLLGIDLIRINGIFHIHLRSQRVGFLLIVQISGRHPHGSHRGMRINESRENLAAGRIDHLRLLTADARRDVPDHPPFRQNVASIQDGPVPYMDSSVFYQVHAVVVPPFLKKADHKSDRPFLLTGILIFHGNL